MTLVETTRSRTHRAKSVADLVGDLDYVKLLRFAVWVIFCVLLIVLA